MSAPASLRRADAIGPGWRALGRFWAAVILVGATAAGALAWLGPPPPVPPLSVPVGLKASNTKTDLPPVVAVPPTAGLEPGGPTPIAAPEKALLEPSTTFPGGFLPRIGADGRMPMRVYAAPFDVSNPHPRVALLLGGIGLAEAGSEDAIRTLPSAVSLVISPYAFRPERLIADARAAGHELFLALPLEPARYPLDDPGDHALLTGNTSAMNAQLLEWAMTRFAGYVGVTGALSDMRGERFADVPELMKPVLQTFAARGLMYIDPRPSSARLPYAVGRDVDAVIDEPAVRSEIDAKLAQLDQAARDHGAALGLVGAPRPVTIDRIAAWASGLALRGLVLAPVSAIAQSPPPAATAAVPLQ